MPAWSTSGGATAQEWFSQRFARARALLPAANFDTINPPEDWANMATTELVDVVGAATLDPVSFYNGGVAGFTLGDNVAASHARLHEVDSPSHVGAMTGKSWYAASLVRLIRPDDVANMTIDMIGLWQSDGNRIGLGVATGSGGSVTNWVGYASKDASVTTSIGPALDGSESPVWHLFEAWFDVVTGKLHFAIDGQEFATTIDADDMPAGPAEMSMIADDGGEIQPAFTINYDKATVIVASPRVGNID